MKRIIALILVVFMLIPALIACGGDNKNEQDPSSDTQTPGDSTTPPDGSNTDGEGNTGNGESDTDTDGSNPSGNVPDKPDEEADPDAQLRFSLSTLNLSVGETRTMNTVYVPMYKSDSNVLTFTIKTSAFCISKIMLPGNAWNSRMS